jgi:hypothetical protein
MSDVVVDEGEWWKLHEELYAIREDAGKVNSFMEQHVNKKWEVLNVCVGFIRLIRTDSDDRAEKWRTSLAGSGYFVRGERAAVAC